jgi:hypothetical protein
MPVCNHLLDCLIDPGCLINPAALAHVHVRFSVVAK